MIIKTNIHCIRKQRIKCKVACTRRSNPPRFEEVLSAWMQSNRIEHKSGTCMKYQFLIDNHILPELGNLPVGHLTTPRINAFLMRKLENGRLDQKGGLSASYVRTIAIVIYAALTYAANEGMCPPLRSVIHKPAVCRHEIKILSYEDQRLIEQMAEKGTNMTELAVMLALHAGLRIGEVCALSWADVDLEKRILIIRHTIVRKTAAPDSKQKTVLSIDTPKTVASARIVPVSSLLYPLLAAAKRQSHSTYVISETNSFVNPRTLENRYRRFLIKCSVPYINFHALRHTFATRCVEVGVDVKSLSEILGHANVSFTLETYVHSSIQMKRTQLEKLANSSESFP